MFQEARHERSMILLLLLTIPDRIKQGAFTDHEITKIKNLAVEKLYRQRSLKDYMALQLLD